MVCEGGPPALCQALRESSGERTQGPWPRQRVVIGKMPKRFLKERKRRKRGQFRDGSLERGKLSEWPRLLGMCPTLVQFGHWCAVNFGQVSWLPWASAFSLINQGEQPLHHWRRDGWGSWRGKSFVNGKRQSETTYHCCQVACGRQVNRSEEGISGFIFVNFSLGGKSKDYF